MKRYVAVLVLALLATTLNVFASPVPVAAYEFKTIIGVPCGNDVPTDLCTPFGNAVALTKVLLGNSSAQGWQLVSTTRMLYSNGNEGVVFLLGRNPSILAPVKLRQYDIVMGTSCGQGPSGVPSRMCTGSGAFLDETLSDRSSKGWQLISTTSCNYQYEQGQIGMAVYVFLK